MLCPYSPILDVFVVARHLNLKTTVMNMMRKRKFRILSFLRIVVTCFIILIFLPTFASSEETYVFERMWPTLQQPWYFSKPTYSVASDKGYIYVVDSWNHRILKFTLEGHFVAQWGRDGNGDGEFHYPYGIAVDSNGYVYVTDNLNYRVQKFTEDGQFVSKWGNEGGKDGEFGPGQAGYGPSGIVVDGSGFVYVADTGNHRVQKFTPEGQFDDKFGYFGSGNGQFINPYDIAVDSSGFFYVADTKNHRVQKLTSDGQYITQWGSQGTNDGQFSWPEGIAVDASGFVYVSCSQNHRIQKFTAEGEFVTKWGGYGVSDGRFSSPAGIATDTRGYVLVADKSNNRIQWFTSNGTFLTKWSSGGIDEARFNSPESIAVDSDGFIYIADTYNNRIQKFTSDGQFVTEWGSYGLGEGEFYYPEGIAVDNNGFIYIADTYNYRIQKFDSNGGFMDEWGSEGTGNGQFSRPRAITADSNGLIYVADTSNHRIQKFNAAGEWLATWGSYGFGDDEFYYPHGIAVDGSGYIYVADTFSSHIKKLNLDGEHVSTWGGYSSGTSDGEFAFPEGITVDGSGFIYVADTLNDRAQKFDANGNFITKFGGKGSHPAQMSRPNDLAVGPSGKIFVADSENNRIQVFNKVTLDTNNKAIIIAGGGPFPGNNLWDATQMCANFAYRALAYQGFTPPAEKERIVITSTSPDESAYFVTQGSISFSNYFWTHIFNGVNLKDSFDLAKDAIGYTTDFQTPLLDANGNGVGNEPEEGTLVQDTYIGNGTVIHGDVPVIGSVSPDQPIDGVTSALLYASDVTDNDGIARVWAVIRPPDYNQGSSDNPVQELPSIDLMPTGTDQYEATYNGFTIEGTYQIAIYARDRIGNTSIPQLTTVSVENPLRRRAIMVVGGLQADDLWPSIEKSATLVYEALTFQGYTDDDIYFMSNVTFSTGVDWLPTLSNISYALTTWALQSTQDVVVYLVGNGEEGAFEINDTETLLASDLDSWLDSLQDNIPGKVTVIYDACRSGSFLSSLTPSVDKERILISSTGEDQPAYFISEGDISFSKFFWRRVLNGANVRNSFLHAKNALSFSCLNQTPHLDDNGNGVGNEKPDGQLAQYYTIGVGIMLAGDDPLIGAISPEQILHGETTATIWVEEVTTTGTIDKVWAVITPPGYSSGQPTNPVTDVPTLEFNHMGDGRYEGTYSDFITIGIYEIAVYAMDTDSNISLPKETRVYKGFGPDTYEEDDLEVYRPIGPLFGFIMGTITNTSTGEPMEGVQITTNGNASALSLPDGTYLIIHPAGTFTVTAQESGYIPVSYSGIVVSEAGTTTRDFGLVPSGDSDGDGVLDSQDNCPNIANPNQEDADEDGVGDVCDAFPNNPNEWLDTDGDLIGNNADLDDDNDDMPDTWEIQYGLDPLDDSDASGDLDGDGVSNLDEYNAGTDPTNSRPDQPILSSPIDNATIESLTPKLQTGDFSDPGDTHAQTQWQISTNTSFSSEYLVLDITSDSHLTSLTVPDSILNESTEYYWQVRFYDNYDGPSAWSDTYSFTTPTMGNDTNLNGIPDDQDVDSTVDMDGDGTPDIDQPDDIKSVNTVVGDGQIGVKEGTNVTSIDSIKSIDPDTISDTTNKPDEMPLGIITFKVTVDNPGDTAELVVYLSEPAPSGAKWYKYDTIHGWQDYSAHATFSPDGTYVTLALKDGDYGDMDGTANRIIVDPSGLAAASTPSPLPPAPSSGGGGGGCFIATAAYGSHMEPHVKVLREFRDRFLINNMAGKAFIHLYTTLSPPVADFIASHDTVRFMVRWSLVPFVGVSWMSLQLGLWAALVFIGLLICFIGASATIALKRMRIRRQV